MSLKILGANDFMKLAQALIIRERSGYGVFITIDKIKLKNDAGTIIIDKENFSELLIATRDFLKSRHNSQSTQQIP